MITYTKEKFAELCSQYLNHLEFQNETPEKLIAAMMRRYQPVGPGTEFFIKLMLMNEEDRKLLAEFCVHSHYVEVGKNIGIGEICEDSHIVAKRLNDIIAKRSEKFINYVDKIEAGQFKKLNKKINSRNSIVATLRKDIKKSQYEIDQLQAQIDKLSGQIEKKQVLLSDTLNEITDLMNQKAEFVKTIN